jgi:large subunit ribosomal protein L31
MKISIHPNYQVTTVTCNACRASYSVGSTSDSLKVELCSNCHPFYTGKQVLVDTDNLIDKFNKKKEQAQTKTLQSRKEKNLRRRNSSTQTKGALTLRDMLNNLN